MNKTNNIRKAVLVIVISLGIALQACNPIEGFRKDIIQPMQQQQGIQSDCGVIC